MTPDVIKVVATPDLFMNVEFATGEVRRFDMCRGTTWLSAVCAAPFCAGKTALPAKTLTTAVAGSRRALQESGVAGRAGFAGGYGLC